jgi:hypothetical protein
MSELPSTLYVVEFAARVDVASIKAYTLVGETTKFWKIRTRGNESKISKGKNCFFSREALKEYLQRQRLTQLESAKRRVSILESPITTSIYEVPAEELGKSSPQDIQV